MCIQYLSNLDNLSNFDSFLAERVERRLALPNSLLFTGSLFGFC